MARPTILITRRLPEPVERYLTEHFSVTLNADDRPLVPNELAAAMRGYDALIPTITDRIDAAMLAQPDRRVRILANFGAGVDHIDLAASQAASVAVTNTPDALTEATAELTILLILMASRRAAEGERELRNGGWAGWRPTHMVGNGLAGRTLGLIGFGRIAQAAAAKAGALGMKVAFYNRSTPPSAITRPMKAIQIATLKELVAVADVLSIQVPGGEATHHLIDRVLLRAMKPEAILVNTARGSVVDEDALADALAEGWIAAAALDVYAEEPKLNPRLLDHPRSVLLPHLGSATAEARNAMGMQAAANLKAFFAGEPLPNRIC